MKKTPAAQVISGANDQPTPASSEEVFETQAVEVHFKSTSNTFDVQNKEETEQFHEFKKKLLDLIHSDLSNVATAQRLLFHIAQLRSLVRRSYIALMRARKFGDTELSELIIEPLNLIEDVFTLFNETLYSQPNLRVINASLIQLISECLELKLIYHLFATHLLSDEKQDSHVLTHFFRFLRDRGILKQGSLYCSDTIVNNLNLLGSKRLQLRPDLSTEANYHLHYITDIGKLYLNPIDWKKFSIGRHRHLLRPLHPLERTRS